MGAWGPGIFSSDTALDVRETYVERLKMGATDEDAYMYVLTELSDYLNDKEDSIDFWLCLASVLSDYGRLTEEVKKKAIDIIEEGDYYRWSNAEKKRREVILYKLKDKLMSKQSKRKEVRVLKPVICPYHPGDIFLHELTTESDCYTQGCQWFCYVLIDEIVNFDTRINGLGDMYPIIYLKCIDHLITQLEELDDYEFVETEGYGSGEHRIQMYRDGYKLFFKSCKYIGNYDFQRTSNIYDDHLFIMRPAREIEELIYDYIKKISLGY